MEDTRSNKWEVKSNVFKSLPPLIQKILPAGITYDGSAERFRGDGGRFFSAETVRNQSVTQITAQGLSDGLSRLEYQFNRSFAYSENIATAKSYEFAAQSDAAREASVEADKRPSTTFSGGKNQRRLSELVGQIANNIDEQRTGLIDNVIGTVAGLMSLGLMAYMLWPSKAAAAEATGEIMPGMVETDEQKSLSRRRREAEKRGEKLKEDEDLSLGDPGTPLSFSPDMRGLMDLIGNIEAMGGNYNAMNAGAKSQTDVAKAGDSKTILGKALTEMTIGEIKALQASGKIHAAGFYQIIPGTMIGWTKALGLSDNQLFDEATQDALGYYGIMTALKPYMSGKETIEQAMQRMANIWAAFPSLERYRLTGQMQSHYTPFPPSPINLEQLKTAILAAAASPELTQRNVTQEQYPVLSAAIIQKMKAGSSIVFPHNFGKRGGQRDLRLERLADLSWKLTGGINGDQIFPATSTVAQVIQTVRTNTSGPTVTLYSGRTRGRGQKLYVSREARDQAIPPTSPTSVARPTGQGVEDLPMFNKTFVNNRLNPEIKPSVAAWRKRQGRSYGELVTVGDSIAVMFSNSPGGGKYTRAAIGAINSQVINELFNGVYGSKLTVVSMGSNDIDNYNRDEEGNRGGYTRGRMTMDNAFALRSNMKSAAVIWLLPYHRRVAAVISRIAQHFGDKVIDLKSVSKTKDAVHPYEWANIHAEINRLMGWGAERTVAAIDTKVLNKSQQTYAALLRQQTKAQETASDQLVAAITATPNAMKNIFDTPLNVSVPVATMTAELNPIPRYMGILGPVGAIGNG